MFLCVVALFGKMQRELIPADAFDAGWKAAFSRSPIDVEYHALLDREVRSEAKDALWFELAYCLAAKARVLFDIAGYVAEYMPDGFHR